MPSMEVTSDFLRVLLSIVTSYYFAASVLPPNPILKPSAQARLSGFFENIRSNAGQQFCMGLVILSLFLGLADVSIIIARNAPSTVFSHWIKTLFLFNGSDHTRMHLTVTQVIAALITFGGGYMRLWAFRALGKFYTFQVGVQKDQRLIKHGLYSIVRHPGYTGLLFATVGFLVWNFSPGSWVRESGLLNTVVGWLMASWLTGSTILMTYMVCISRPPQEDMILHKAFGKEWEQWARNVPYRTIPGVL